MLCCEVLAAAHRCHRLLFLLFTTKGLEGFQKEGKRIRFICYRAIASMLSWFETCPLVYGVQGGPSELIF